MHAPVVAQGVGAVELVQGGAQQALARHRVRRRAPLRVQVQARELRQRAAQRRGAGLGAQRGDHAVLVGARGLPLRLLLRPQRPLL